MWNRDIMEMNGEDITESVQIKGNVDVNLRESTI